MLRQCLRLHNARQFLHYRKLHRTTILRHATTNYPSKPSLSTRLQTSLNNTLTRTHKRLDPRNLTFAEIISLQTWLIGLLLFGHIWTGYFFSFLPCHGISMLPTLNSYGDWVLISKYYRRGRQVDVGDLVSFRLPTEEGVDAIKRVLGLEGDFVMLDTPTRDGDNMGREGGGGRMIQIPQGHCWIVGDNLPHSRDSRLFGPLPLALIKGKVIAKFRPWQWIDKGLRDVVHEDDID